MAERVKDTDTPADVPEVMLEEVLKPSAAREQSLEAILASK
jgi:hypothetical protein